MIQKTIRSAGPEARIYRFGRLPVNLIIITVSNGDFDSNVALKADGSGITVTGSRRINGVVIRIRYTKPMEDTLKIEKSLGGKVENTAEDEYRWWLNFAMSGQASTVNTQPVDVLFVIDRSGSMSNKMGKMLKNALNGDGSAWTEGKNRIYLRDPECQ